MCNKSWDFLDIGDAMSELCDWLSHHDLIMKALKTVCLGIL